MTSYTSLLNSAINTLPDARRKKAKRIMQERNTRDSIVKLLRKTPRLRFISMTGVEDVGCEDIIVCYRGVFAGIECKNARGALSPAQEQVRTETLNSGGLWIKARTVKDVRALLDRIEKYYGGGGVS